MSKCKMGDNLNADVSLVGCYLMKHGIVRKEKEEIKELVGQIVLAHLNRQIEEIEKEINEWGNDVKDKLPASFPVLMDKETIKQILRSHNPNLKV